MKKQNRRNNNNGLSREIIFISILVLIPCILYVPFMSNSWIYEDVIKISENHFINEMGAVPYLIFGDYEHNDASWDYFTITQKENYRPLPSIFLWLLWNSGLDQAIFFKILGLLLVIGCSLLIYFIIKAISRSKGWAFGSALFFSVHPMLVLPVHITYFRDSLWALFFSLLSLLFYVHYRQMQKDTISTASFLGKKPTGNITNYVLFCVSFLFATLSYEYSWLIIVVMLLFDKLYLIEAKKRSFLQASGPVWTNYLYPTVIFVIMAIWRYAVLKSPSDSGDISFFESLLMAPVTTSQAIVFSLSTPGLRTIHSMSTAQNFADTGVAAGIIIILISAGAIILSKRLSSRIWIGALIWILGFASYTNIIPMGSVLFDETNIFLSIIGAGIALSAIILHYQNTKKAISKYIMWIGLGIFAFFSVITLVRNINISNNIRYLSYEIEHNISPPTSLYLSKAYTYYQNEDYQNALSEYDKILEINPYHTASLYFAGICQVKLENYHEAIDYFEVIDHEDLKYIGYADINENFNLYKLLGNAYLENYYADGNVEWLSSAEENLMYALKALEENMLDYDPDLNGDLYFELIRKLGIVYQKQEGPERWLKMYNLFNKVYDQIIRTHENKHKFLDVLYYNGLSIKHIADLLDTDICKSGDDPDFCKNVVCDGGVDRYECVTHADHYFSKVNEIYEDEIDMNPGPVEYIVRSLLEKASIAQEREGTASACIWYNKAASIESDVEFDMPSQCE